MDRNIAHWPASKKGKVGKIRHLALDMDGTIYRGKTLFPTTIPFLKLLNQLKIGYTFLTNNPSKSNNDYHAKLHGMGIKTDYDQLYTSAQSTIEYLQQNWPKIKRLFVVGTPSMCDTFAAAGYRLTDDNPKQRPDGVVVGFDPTLTYARLCRAAWWIARDVPYFATNPDAVCPTDEPTVLIDCGSVTAALERATGKSPMAVMGKPDVAMLRGILKRHGLAPHELGMVGDRLYTDIAMAQRAGAVGILVLTGETTKEQAAHARPGPDITVAGLAELGKALKRARTSGEGRTTRPKGRSKLSRNGTI